MEQSFTWYTLLLKAWMKKKSSWLVTVGMFAMIFVISQIHLPSSDNTSVGICILENEYGQKMMNALSGMDSVFSFQRYQDEEALLSDVESGVLECGFLFADDFEEKMQTESLEQLITYVCTPLTTKGTVAKETLYTAFLQLYGEQILKGSEPEIYGTLDEALADTGGILEETLTDTLLEKYQYYLENSRLLQMKTEMIKTEQDASFLRVSSENIYPIQGLVGVFLVLILWLECGRKFEQREMSVYAALDRKRRGVFEYCGYLAAVTIPAVVGGISILLFAEHRGVVKEIGLLIFFLFLAALWVLLIGKFFKRSMTFAAWALTLVGVQLLICPVFVDLAEYFPALGVLRWVFPLSWYLL